MLNVDGKELVARNRLMTQERQGTIDSTGPDPAGILIRHDK